MAKLKTVQPNLLLYIGVLAGWAGWLAGTVFCKQIPIESVAAAGYGMISFYWITRRLETAVAAALSLSTPLLLFEMFYHRVHFLLPFLTVLVLILSFFRAVRLGLFSVPGENPKNEKAWRFYIRPFAVLFILLDLWFGKSFVLILTGGVALIISTVDVIRLFSGNFNRVVHEKGGFLFRGKERFRPSSMTYFMLACFLSFLLFPEPAAIMAVLFMIFGDFYSKFFGMRYGRLKIFNKTLEGSLAHFIACLLLGAGMMNLIEMPGWIFMSGAAAASITELLPWKIDDNLSVALVSGLLMWGLLSLT